MSVTDARSPAWRALTTGTGFAIFIPLIESVLLVPVVLLWSDGDADFSWATLFPFAGVLFVSRFVYHAIPAFLIGVVMGGPSSRRKSRLRRAIGAAATAGLLWLLIGEPETEATDVWAFLPGVVLVLAAALVAALIGKDRSPQI